jgi:hypothetical protein
MDSRTKAGHELTQRWMGEAEGDSQLCQERFADAGTPGEKQKLRKQKAEME